MQIERVVEIFDPSRGEFGSGYALSSTHVLTASHALARKGTAPAEHSEYVLRALADASAESSGKATAKCVWADPKLDLAILEIVRRPAFQDDDDERFSREPWGAPDLGEIEQLDPCPCSGVGFPNFTAEGPRKDTYQLEGTVYPGTYAKDGLLMVKVNSPQPRRPEDWEGISGTAVFADGKLFGVVVVTDLAYKDSVILVRAISDAADNPDFGRLLNAIGAVPIKLIGSSQVSQDVFIRLRDLACYIDRQPQRNALEAALDQTKTEEVGRPVICVIDAATRRDCEALMKRFEEYDLPRLRGLWNRSIIPIEWAQGGRSPANGLKLLLGDLDRAFRPSSYIQQYVTAERLDPRSPQHLSQILNQQGMPRAFVSYIDRTRFDDIQRRTLGLWLDFWSEVGEAQLGDAVLVFLCTYADAGVERPAKRGLGKLFGFRTRERAPEPIIPSAGRRNVQISPLPELKNIPRGDVGGWSKWAQSRTPPGLQRDIVYVEISFLQKIESEPEFPFTWFDRHIDEHVGKRLESLLSLN